MWYDLYHVSKIVCIDLNCDGFELVLIEVELIHLYVQNVLDQFELKLIQMRYIQIR